eukprot:Clim_evm4s167 gene=Clim_evmTU4s167
MDFQLYWDSLRAWAGNDMLLFNAMFMIVHGVCYFGLGILHLAAWKHGWFKQYKIQEEKFPDEQLLKTAIKKAIFTQMILQPIGLYYLWEPLHTRLGVERLMGPLPSLWEVLWQNLFFAAVEDTLFFWSHWFLHRKFIYKYIHKQHHEFNVSTAFAAEYAHPLENIFGNTVPVLAGPWMVCPHAVTFMIWLAFRIIKTVEAHGGYEFPYSPFNHWPLAGAARHDYHHSHNVGTFCSFTVFWDYVIGSQGNFEAWRARIKEGKMDFDPAMPPYKQPSKKASTKAA